MKTILQALKDDVHYPLTDGFLENRLLCRGLTATDDFTAEVSNSASYKGAFADCLYSLIEAPSFSEADKSINAADRELILKKVNALYNAIGEPSVTLLEEPRVIIGG